MYTFVDMPTTRPLTPRQHQILRLVAHGATNKEIAGELGISEQGVKVHISRLLERYGADNRVELVNVTRAWADSDQRGYASLAADVAGIRASLQKTSASPGLGGAVSALRDLLAEVDVAVKLAKELPPDVASGPLFDAIRARVRAALAESDRLATLIEQEQVRPTGELSRATAS
jgi:DNA-binding CsgD family transcriptional regulator